MTIERNHHPLGQVNNMVFGLCQLGDGMVRVLSGGWLHTTWPIKQAQRAARRYFDHQKENAAQEAHHERE